MVVFTELRELTMSLATLLQNVSVIFTEFVSNFYRLWPTRKLLNVLVILTDILYYLQAKEWFSNFYYQSPWKFQVFWPTKKLQNFPLNFTIYDHNFSRLLASYRIFQKFLPSITKFMAEIFTYYQATDYFNNFHQFSK